MHFFQIHQEAPRVVSSKTAHSNVPAFASGLGMTLEPIKAKETSSGNIAPTPIIPKVKQREIAR